MMASEQNALLDEFLESGGTILEPGSSEYPESIAAVFQKRNKVMPTLYVHGNLEPLYTPGIGLCGSRNVSSPGWEMAEVLGGIVSQTGYSLVSGYAVGVDTAGHVSAITSGGRTTAVLAEGLSHFRLRPEYSDPHEAEHRMTVVSQFRLQSRWTTINAMTRNFMICALSSALFAIEPGERGGTLNAAQEGLRQAIPVFVVTDPHQADHSPAVERLLNRGAVLVKNETELREVISNVSPLRECSPVADQPRLL